MANVNIPDLTALTAPATADVIEVYDDSAAQNKSLALSYLTRADGNGPQITGGGTIALGGYTLTIPATGTAALRGTAQTFTAGQTISTAGGGSPEQLLIQQSGNNAIRLYTTSAWGLATNGALLQMYNGAATEILRLDTRSGNQSYVLGHVGIGTTTDSAQLTAKAGSTTTVGLVVDTPASQISATQLWQYNGTSRANLYATSSTTVLTMMAFDNGSAEGPHVRIERNSNASTPAAGHIKMHNLSGTFYYLWVDATGDLRIGTTAPTNANDTSGTVVGTQS